MRASRADREQAIGTLKAAFVQGRLTKNELDERVGRALVPLTYAELAALTGDLPDGLTAARRPRGDGQSKARLQQSSAAKAGVVEGGGRRWRVGRGPGARGMRGGGGAPPRHTRWAMTRGGWRAGGVRRVNRGGGARAPLRRPGPTPAIPAAPRRRPAASAGPG